MEKLIIRGGKALKGTIPISGAKNAALPLMCAALLTDEPLTLINLPRLRDIRTMADLLNHHGAAVTMLPGLRGRPIGHRLTLHAPDITDTTAPYDIVRQMRASILVLGSVLAREGVARVSLPGGCAIGNRPIDLHLKGLTALGAHIDLAGGYVEARAPDGLIGATYHFSTVSVGATENLLMAATLARGQTVLENAAKEPEIIDLARCLRAMGADIEGEGTATLRIQGVDRLHGCDYRVMPDRIEAGSYAIAAAITGGDLTLDNVEPGIMGATLMALREAGVTIEENDTSIRITSNGRAAGIDLNTMPFPGFATDMQAQFMALLTLADGASVITESIFENRFMHVPELTRMGADITVNGSTATIRGVDGLIGAPVMATDLRASMGLVLAGLAARGETTVNRLYHLDRGYERLEEKLVQVGADIERVTA